MQATHPIKSGFLVALLLLTTSTVCYGLDTDLYVLSGANIPPNVLIILDNSASMDEVSSGQIYDPTIDYSAYNPSTVYPANAVYTKSGSKWTQWHSDYTVTDFPCPNLRDNYLIPFGEAINYTGCGVSKKDFQSGNFMNYLQLTGGPGGSRPRFGLANGIIHSYINTTGGVRFAVMTFNNDTTGKTVKYNGGTKEEYVLNPNGFEDAMGGRVLGFVDENKDGKTTLFNNLSGLKNETWSPLAETLSMTETYFRTGLNGFARPVQYSCQKNYVLIISDGDPTKDTGELDKVAQSLFNLDLSPETPTSKQNIKTYTIGFSITHQILEDTAKAGGGKYFYVWSSQSFNIAFQAFIAEVLKESTSYVAPVVPISQMERTSSGNRMFLAMFKPTERSFWKGNIKKYGIATKIPEGEAENIGDILDSGGKLAINSNNQIYDVDNGDSYSAKSYWSSEADGQDVEAGGVGEKLQLRDLSSNPRKIYTYLGTNVNLTDSSNAFTKSITPQQLGLSEGDTTGRDKVVDFIYGWDVYDENRNTKTDEKREWILGAFIHSRPVVIHYSDRSVIYAGANDGMLHAFHNGVPNGDTWTDGTGEELWAFIPPNLLPSLKNLNGEALQFFVDGSPKVYIGKDGAGNDVKYLIFGLRRGGNRYIALDVTDPTSPKWLWEISPSTTGFGELGQTWSTPLIGKIKYGSGEKWVSFIGGGYDENQDNIPVTANDTKGRAVYVIDVLTGGLIWSYSYAKNSQMKYSIPSDIARVDTNGYGYIDRLYVGDMGGQIWRFDIDVRDANNQNNPANWTGKIIFQANPGASEKRKIFYPPDVTLEKGYYEMLFFGTGDREAPKEKTVINRLYAVKDKNLSTILKEDDLFDVTNVEATFATVDAKSGWYIRLGDAGEKSLSTSVVFHGVVYYTTFTPSIGEPGDVCFLGEGTGRLYALKYKTGYAALDLNDKGTISPIGDRSTSMGKEGGTTIPSGVIITFIGGTAVAYAGVGGGVYIPPLPSTKSLIPINWRTVTK